MKDRSFFVSVPADPQFLRAIRAFFQPLLTEVFGDATTQMLILALDEACSNMIKHAGEDSDGRRIDVESTLGAQGLTFRLGDFCCQSDVPNIKPRDLSVPKPGGLGTHFMARIMDSVRYEKDPRREGRVMLVLEKGLEPIGDPPREA